MKEHRTPVSLSTYRTYTLPWKLYLINHYSIFIMTLIRWSYRYLTQYLTVLTIISLFYFTYYYAFNQWLITDQLQRKGWKILRTIKARRTNFFGARPNSILKDDLDYSDPQQSLVMTNTI